MRKHSAPAAVSGIGVLDKAMSVLHSVAEAPCNLGELCARTGLPRAIAHRLALGLEVHRLLARDADGLWRPGPGLAELAPTANDNLLEAAVARAIQMSHEKYCSASIMLGKTADITVSHEIVAA